MKGDTPLDYAEFQLTPKRTRCELFVSADGIMEKLASGFVKPFITHLRTAELQVVKGSNFIRLETKSECEKNSLHNQGKETWFSKGTIERFVRFVSTPEIIERVKTIEDELTQLEQVRIALVNTFAQTSDRFPYGDAAIGQQQSRDATDTLVPRRFSTDKEDNESDASKKELLRAMEARLNALHQEQDIAFARANAAGFDNNNIANLIIFAQQFGADRLHDACAHFVGLLHKKTLLEGGQEGCKSPAFETPSDASGFVPSGAYGSMLVSKEEGFLQSTRRKLDFGDNRSQAKSGGNEIKGIDTAKKESGLKGNNIADVTNDRMYHARLQQITQQVDARSKDEFRLPMDGEQDFTCQDSENQADSSLQKKLSNFSVTEKNASLPSLRVRTEGSAKQHPSLFKTGTTRDEDEGSKQKDSARVPEETSSVEPDKSNGIQGDAPAKRLSVQAAISLFESKKDSNEPPFRKLTKQESRKTLGEGVSSPSEKSVLKRWTTQSPRHVDSNTAQEMQALESKVPEIKQEFGEAKLKGEANQISATLKNVVDISQSRMDEQAKENFKKSLSSILQQDLVQHLEQGNKSKSMDANVQHSKYNASLTQEPSSSTGGSNIRLDPKNLPSLVRNALVAKLGTEKAVLEAAVATMMIKTVSVKELSTDLKSNSESESNNHLLPPRKSTDNKAVLVNELSTDLKSNLESESNNHLLPPRKSIDNKAMPEHKEEDKEMVKIQYTKETLVPKPSQIVPARSRIPSQVSARAAFEPVHSGIQEAAVLQSEQVSEKKTERVSQKEPPAVNDKQTGRNTRFGKPSVQKKTNSVNELPTNLLVSSIDLHMQALVQMVEHQYTNSTFNGTNLAHEQGGEQRGRFYDRYAKLRDAKLRGEHPAKKAEREAKLKSMQETLERRRAEMQTRAVRIMKKKGQDARPADPGGEQMPQNVGMSAAMVEQKDLKVEDDDTDQEEYPVKSQGQVLDYSSPTSPSTTPRSSKGRSLSMKLQGSSRTMPTLSKSGSGNRNWTRGGGSSPKPLSKNCGGATNQGKPSSLTTSTADSIVVKSVLNVRDGARTSVIRPGGSARVHPRLTVTATEVTTLMDDPSDVCSPGNVERQEFKHQPTLARKNTTISRSLNMDTGISLAFLKDQQERAPDALDTTPQRTGSTQEARPYLRKGRGICAGAGPGIAKEKASIPLESPEGLLGDRSTDSKQDEFSIESKIINISPENLLEDFAANDERLVQNQDCSASRIETVLTAIDESGSVSSRPSTEPTESGDMEASDEFLGSVSESKKLVPDIIISRENSEKIVPEVVQTAPQVVNQKQKEVVMLSELFSQKNSATVDKSTSHVASSVSFREASLLPHGHIGSPFPASVSSHPFSSRLHRGAVSSRFSPPREDLPSSNPALWNVSESSKLVQDGELAHSARRLPGNQRQPSMLPLPPKEPSKGFKRLLHFGRKSRMSENTTDCVSVSTTSEGDDDADEARESGSQLSDELPQKTRMQRRGSEYGNLGDQVSHPDQDTSQFFGTAIPPPPANFKLREELLSGGNLIKAPRSFFSLSSFRSSKGSEGKSR